MPRYQSKVEPVVVELGGKEFLADLTEAPVKKAMAIARTAGKEGAENEISSIIEQLACLLNVPADQLTAMNLDIREVKGALAFIVGEINKS